MPQDNEPSEIPPSMLPKPPRQNLHKRKNLHQRQDLGDQSVFDESELDEADEKTGGGGGAIVALLIAGGILFAFTRGKA